MGLKKRAKVSATFNMSSLTDIIFLLLIFFMLTSSLVAPNALNLKLPGQSRTTVSAPSQLDDVRISGSEYFYNGRRISLEQLEEVLAEEARRRGAREYAITISPDRGAPVEAVVAVMDMAMRYDINGVLAAED